MGEKTPLNHSYEAAIAPDLSYPKGDLLNRVVFKLAQQNLRKLYVRGWRVSPALWGAAEDKSNDLLFPHLQTVDITFPLITYDGRWFYTGDPNEVEPLQGGDPGEESEPNSDSDRDSNLSSDSGSWGEDKVYVYREAVLNGDEPSHWWRLKPDPDMFYPLVRAMVTAAMRMPKLEHLIMEASSENYFEIAFEYIRQGWLASTIPLRYQTEQQRGKWRWIVLLGLEAPHWEIPADIRQLMEQHVGGDGEVIQFSVPFY